MAALLSDADVGLAAGPKLQSDADVGLAQPAPATTGPDFDPTSQPFARDDQAPSDLGPAAGRIANAAVQGWRDTPPVLAQPTQDFLDQSPVGAGIINPAAKLAGAVPATAHAGMAALSQAAMEVFGEKGGRDALALLSTLPMAHGEAMSPEVASAPAGEAPPATPMFDAAASQFTGSPYEPVTAMQVAARDGIGIDDAYRRAGEENRAGAAEDAARAATPHPSPADIASSIMAAGNVGDAIKAATDAVQAPAPALPATGDLFAEQASPPVEAPETPVIPGSEPAAGIPAGPNGPAPQSAGAAASAAGDAAMSTKDMKANRYTAEMAELLAPAAAGDTMVHVPGSFPTLAERSGDPLISQTENMLRQRNAGAFVGEGVGGLPAKPLTANNNARVDAFDNETPTRTALDTMRDDRSAQWNADSASILPTAKPVDFTPAAEWVEDQLNDPRIDENTAVRGVLEKFQDQLTGPDGNLKTDPARAWGIHDDLQTQIAKAKDPLNATGAERYALGQLLQAKGLVDDALNVSTGNQFQTALDNYATASQAINAGQELEAFRPKLTNAAGEIQGQRFHTWVTGLAKLRGDPGIDPAMSISDGTMRTLINIDTDLKRAGLIKLGGAAGSPTNLLGALATSAGLNAAHSILGSVPFVGEGLKGAADLIAQRRLQAMTAKHLAPPEGGYTYPEQDALDPALVAAQQARGGQTPPAAPAAPAPVAVPAGLSPSPAASVGVTPIATRLSTPNGTVVPGRYVVREMRDVIASQRRDGADNPAYDQSLQPRDRSRKASVAQVADMAANPRFGEIGFSNTTATGAPVIGRARSLLPGEEPTPDNPAMVESGNARTMMQDQIYGNGGPNAGMLRASVAEHAKALGQDISGMSRPALFFERSSQLGPAARAKLADDMGAQPVADLSATERASGDARRMPNDTLAMIQPGDLTSVKNAPFARAFAEHVVPPAERASFITADGELSQQGAARVRNALAQVAYQSGDLVASLGEDANPEIKRFGDALMEAAGPMAKLRGLINDGTISAVRDIAPDIVAAAELVRVARRGGFSLADAVSQTTMLARPAETETILQAAYGPDYGGQVSRIRFAGFLSDYAERAQVQDGLFGVGQTTAEILGEAGAEYGHGRKTGTGADTPGAGLTPGPGADLVREAVRPSADSAPGPEAAPGTAGRDAGQDGAGEEAGEVTPPRAGLINSTGAMATPKPLSDPTGPYIVRRAGADPGGNLPDHGLYVTSAADRAYNDAGEGQQVYEAAPKNPLRVSVNEPQRARSQTNYSAGTEAARALLGAAETSRLMSLSESAARSEAQRLGITLPEGMRASQRLTEILGARAARAAGHDAIIMGHGTSHGEPAEMVVLDKSILSAAR